MEDPVGLTGLVQAHRFVTWVGKDPLLGGTLVLCGQALGVTALCQSVSLNTSKYSKGLELLNCSLDVHIFSS